LAIQFTKLEKSCNDVQEVRKKSYVALTESSGNKNLTDEELENSAASHIKSLLIAEYVLFAVRSPCMRPHLNTIL